MRRVDSADALHLAPQRGGQLGASRFPDVESFIVLGDSP